MTEKLTCDQQRDQDKKNEEGNTEAEQPRIITFPLIDALAHSQLEKDTPPKDRLTQGLQDSKSLTQQAINLTQQILSKFAYRLPKK